MGKKGGQRKDTQAQHYHHEHHPIISHLRHPRTSRWVGEEEATSVSRFYLDLELYGIPLISVEEHDDGLLSMILVAYFISSFPAYFNTVKLLKPIEDVSRISVT